MTFIRERLRRSRSSLLLTFVAIFSTAIWTYSLTEHEELHKDFSDVSKQVADAQLTASRQYYQPRQHVYFLKTHKCASSSLQKIFLLYGIRNNLSFALPPGGRNYFYPEPFRPDLAKRTATYPTFDIMAVHSRFSPDSFRYMPNDTMYVAVVRDPADQLQSAFQYLHVGACGGRGTFEQLMASNLSEYNRRIPYTRNFCAINMLRNMQLYDFGVDLPAAPTLEQVNAAVLALDEMFDVVVVVDLFDESLIVLRDALRWTTSDVLYFQSNFQINVNRSMSAQARRAANSWNWADRLLYEHFRRKMAAEVQRQNDYIRTEVAKLRRLQRAMFDYCVRSVSSVASSQLTLGHYELTETGAGNATCVLLTMPEAELIDLVNRLWP